MNTVRKALAALGLLVLAAPSAADAAPPALFGTVEFRAASLSALPQWQRTLAAIERERAVYDACSRDPEACPSRGVSAWRSLVRSQHGRAPMDQLNAVNRFLNHWRYKTDAQNYGRRDYWATPLEFLRRSGDCEDYAIIKYVTLRELGFTADELRVVVVQDTVREIAHAVLAVYLDDQIYILDNLSAAILPQAEVTQYVPYYSINESSRWAHVTPLSTVASRGADREPPTPSSPRRAR